MLTTPHNSGLPNYCYCPKDGTCWAVSDNDCSPTSKEQLDPCPAGDSTSGKKLRWVS
jgi:hypothetical protein